MKTCKKCKIEKELTEYYSRGDKVYNTCKQCEMEYRRNFKKNNPEKVKDRDRKYALKKLYGISPEEYDEMLINQDFCCKICGRHHTEFNKSLTVDHNHITGAIRGLLCNNCNLMIGNALDNPDILLLGSQYLKDEAIV